LISDFVVPHIIAVIANLLFKKYTTMLNYTDDFVDAYKVM